MSAISKRKTLIAILGLLMGLLVALPTATAQEPVARSTAEESASLTAKLEIAYAQHELILLYIKTDQFDKVLPEIQILINLRLPAENEIHTVESLAIITERLFQKGRGDLAHQILDAAIHALGDNANKSKIYLVQARFYKLEGQTQKAIECYRKSTELNRRTPE